MIRFQAYCIFTFLMILVAIFAVTAFELGAVAVGAR